MYPHFFAFLHFLSLQLYAMPVAQTFFFFKDYDELFFGTNFIIDDALKCDETKLNCALGTHVLRHYTQQCCKRLKVVLFMHFRGFKWQVQQTNGNI